MVLRSAYYFFKLAQHGATEITTILKLVKIEIEKKKKRFHQVPDSDLCLGQKQNKDNNDEGSCICLSLPGFLTESYLSIPSSRAFVTLSSLFFFFFFFFPWKSASLEVKNEAQKSRSLLRGLVTGCDRCSKLSSDEIPKQLQEVSRTSNLMPPSIIILCGIVA